MNKNGIYIFYNLILPILTILNYTHLYFILKAVNANDMPRLEYHSWFFIGFNATILFFEITGLSFLSKQKNVNFIVYSIYPLSIFISTLTLLLFIFAGMAGGFKL